MLLHGSLLPSSPSLVLLIFLAEMCVVTLGTLRIIFVSRGMKLLASLLGFFEISIWLFAIGQIMQNLSEIHCFAAFAGGFTAGNFLGILIEKKLAIGTQVVRIITRRDAGRLIDSLKSAGYGVTALDGQGATGPVQLVFTVIKRKQLPEVLAIIKRFDPHTFYSIDDVQAAAEGVFPASRGAILPGMARLQRAA
jgi:uncharacterized protein YebE (UPF0316 family)